jgi:hypothetical protein
MISPRACSGLVAHPLLSKHGMRVQCAAAQLYGEELQFGAYASSTKETRLRIWRMSRSPGTLSTPRLVRRVLNVRRSDASLWSKLPAGSMPCCAVHLLWSASRTKAVGTSAAALEACGMSDTRDRERGCQNATPASFIVQLIRVDDLDQSNAHHDCQAQSKMA